MAKVRSYDASEYWFLRKVWIWSMMFCWRNWIIYEVRMVKQVDGMRAWVSRRERLLLSMI